MLSLLKENPLLWHEADAALKKITQSRQDGLRHFRASIMDTDCNSRKVPMDIKV
jgi:hypothetical protein